MAQKVQKPKYPNAVRPGGSEFLRRRLEKGHKFFDSGDYNMAKADQPGGGVATVPHPPLQQQSAPQPPQQPPPAAQLLMQHRMSSKQQLTVMPPITGDDGEGPKPILGPDEIRTSKNSPPPKQSKLAAN